MVRDYILAQAMTLGLNPKVEKTGKLENIVVRIPGGDPTLDLLVTSHYDSQATTPGASDGGIAVVAMIESLRVLKARPGLRNDVVFLFSDGEELGWQGASAFVTGHPEALQRTGVLLGFDARPGNAPLRLVETSPGDAWLVRHMAGISLPLFAGSWGNAEDRPNVAYDFDVFQAAGYYGISFENEANGTRYHTPRDTPEAVSPGLVQAYGQTLTALVERFGNLDLNIQNRGTDMVFFTLPLVGIVYYPMWVMTGLSILTIVGFIILAANGWRKKLLIPVQFLVGFLLILLITGLCMFLAQFAWSQAAKNHGEIPFEGSAAWIAWLMILSSLLVAAWLAFWSRRLGSVNLVAAAIVVYLMTGLSAYWFGDTDNPLTTAYLAWPLLGGVTGMAILLFTKSQAWKVSLLCLAAFLVLSVIVPELVMATFTREGAWLPVLLTCLVVGLLTPQIGTVFSK
jgi:hypothetical protein